MAVKKSATVNAVKTTETSKARVVQNATSTVGRGEIAILLIVMALLAAGATTFALLA